MSAKFKIASHQDTERFIEELKNQEQQLRSQLNSVEKRAKQAAISESRRLANELLNEMQAIEDHLEHQLDGISHEMKANYLEHKKDLNKVSRDLQQNISKLEDWTVKSINQLENKVDHKFKEQQIQITQNKEHIRQIFENKTANEQRAQKGLKDLAQLLKVVDKNSKHQKFAEGELSKINKRLNNLTSSDMPSESIIAESFEITNRLYDLETDIAKNESLFNVKHSMILNQAKELLEIMAQNKKELCYKDENGNNMLDEAGKTISLEVNFWTENKYQETENEVQEIEAELIKQKDSKYLNNNRLEVLEAQLVQLKEKQDELVVQACKRGLASEERVVISDDLIQAFMEQGFDLKDGSSSHDFMGSEERNSKTDQREGVVAVLENNLGTQITLIVQPDETKTKNNIIFHRNDENELSEVQFTSFLEEVRTYLKSKDYEIGNLNAPKGIGDVRLEELVDINALKSKGLKKGIKKQLSNSI